MRGRPLLSRRVAGGDAVRRVRPRVARSGPVDRVAAPPLRSIAGELERARRRDDDGVRNDGPHQSSDLHRRERRTEAGEDARTNAAVCRRALPVSAVALPVRAAARPGRADATAERIAEPRAPLDPASITASRNCSCSSRTRASPAALPAQRRGAAAALDDVLPAYLRGDRAAPTTTAAPAPPRAGHDHARPLAVHVKPLRSSKFAGTRRREGARPARAGRRSRSTAARRWRSASASGAIRWSSSTMCCSRGRRISASAAPTT